MSSKPISDRAIAQAFWEKFDVFAFGDMDAIRDRARELDATAAPVVVGEDLLRVLMWLDSDDTGSSSKSIVYHMLGLESGGFHPYDPSDLGRCLRMLELFPAWKPRIEEMATYSQEWARLAPRWSKLSAMMADEVGIDWSKGKRAPRTYAALTSALAGD